jgi:hypothetical protein
MRQAPGSHRHSSFYSPDWNADEILALAASLRPGPQPLKKLDAHTITCQVAEITYIPVPGQSQQPIPGLMTLQLPLSVRDGQRFIVDVQQHSGFTFRRTRTESGPAEGNTTSRQDYTLSERKVLGAFRLTVAVKAGDPLVRKLVRNLAVLKYIFQAIPSTDSWRPVFERYIRQLGDQVGGLGVDPEQVPPSADDPGVPGDKDGTDAVCYTGKVSEVVFNCFGNFDGFVLDTCDECHDFRSTEPAIGELVMRACKERLSISVCVRKGREKRICEIIVLSGHSARRCD